MIRRIAVANALRYFVKFFDRDFRKTIKKIVLFLSKIANKNIAY